MGPQSFGSSDYDVAYRPASVNPNVKVSVPNDNNSLGAVVSLSLFLSLYIGVNYLLSPFFSCVCVCVCIHSTFQVYAHVVLPK